MPVPLRAIRFPLCWMLLTACAPEPVNVPSAMRSPQVTEMTSVPVQTASASVPTANPSSPASPLVSPIASVSASPTAAPTPLSTPVPSLTPTQAPNPEPGSTASPVSFASVQALLLRSCSECHSFTGSHGAIALMGPRIRDRVFVARNMPQLGSWQARAFSDSERSLIAQWVDEGMLGP